MSSGQTGHITGQMGRVPGTDGTHTIFFPHQSIAQKDVRAIDAQNSQPQIAQVLQKPVFALPDCQRMSVNTLLCDTLGLAECKRKSQEPRRGGFLEGGFCKNVRLSCLWRCWAQHAWALFVFFGATLDYPETPFADTLLNSWFLKSTEISEELTAISALCLSAPKSRIAIR